MGPGAHPADGGGAATERVSTHQTPAGSGGRGAQGQINWGCLCVYPPAVPTRSLWPEAAPRGLGWTWDGSQACVGCEYAGLVVSVPVGTWPRRAGRIRAQCTRGRQASWTPVPAAASPAGSHTKAPYLDGSLLLSDQLLLLVFKLAHDVLEPPLGRELLPAAVLPQ